jgi:hypothetical protein
MSSPSATINSSRFGYVWFRKQSTASRSHCGRLRVGQMAVTKGSVWIVDDERVPGVADLRDRPFVMIQPIRLLRLDRHFADPRSDERNFVQKMRRLVRKHVSVFEEVGSYVVGAFERLALVDRSVHTVEAGLVAGDFH